MAKMVLLVGISVSLTSISVFAVPLNVTFTGAAPAHFWGDGVAVQGDAQYEDIANVASQSPANGELNLAGVTSINVTWNAPAGYMYVLTPPPAGLLVNGALNLQLETSYGFSSPAQFSLADSLGHVTSQSISVNTIYGTSPFSEGVSVGGTAGLPVALNVVAGATINANTQPFAFNSITVSAEFSGTGAAGTLDESGNWDGIADYFAVLFGLPHVLGTPFNGPADPGQLLTLEPLPTASTPDDSPTLTLAGLGFAGLLLVGRRLLTAC